MAYQQDSIARQHLCKKRIAVLAAGAELQSCIQGRADATAKLLLNGRQRRINLLQRQDIRHDQ